MDHFDNNCQQIAKLLLLISSTYISFRTKDTAMIKHDLETIRHSTAHLMAQALIELYPNEKIQLGIGPVIENGFYYDIDTELQIGDEQLPLIEKKMKELIKKKIPIERHEINRQDAIKLFKKLEQPLKVELIEDFPDEEVITYYTQGNFIDLCRGPHVNHTGELSPYFKLLNTAGAYWRGQQDKKMLQRIYAVCFDSKESLKEHLNFLEQAKKRDHRKLGKELHLFHFDPVAPASPFFLPKGAHLYNALIDFMREVYKRYNYQEVITPQVLDAELWHTSGHYEHYHENMYFTKIDEREFAFKPMNCPCHMLMFSNFKYSYRDLPLRYADFGRLHRYERSGVVSGLTRVRTFCQDDAHIFIQPEKIQAEIEQLIEMFFICYKHFDFQDIKVALSTRPEKKVGSDEIWDNAEKALEKALQSSGVDFHINEGDGAFYGPKIDIQVADALKRYHQLGTIQLDFQLPERFDLKYTNQEGQSVRPVVIHRALLGSLERFIGVYIEHVGGAFPFWLAPVQAKIIPVKNELHLEHAAKITQQFSKLGFRIQLDERNETMGLKTRETQKAKIPYMIVIGDQEIEKQTLSLRAYGEQKTSDYSIEETIEIFQKLNQQKLPQGLRDFS